MRRILIDEEKSNPQEYTYGFPWKHDSTCYNFNMPEESVSAIEISEIGNIEDIETLVVGCDLSDYGFIRNMINLRQLYIYSGSSIHDLDFIKGLNKLSQLYITKSHVESLEPVIEFVMARRQLFDAEKDPHKRLFMFIEGICIDSDYELDGTSLAESNGFVSEIIINRRRIKE